MPATHRSRLLTALVRGLLLGAVPATTLSSCATNPATGEQQLSLISESQEIQMGQQAAQEVQQTIGFVDDEQLQAYVQRVGESLARRTERPNLPWTFRVVDDPTPNAFALPGGYVFVTRGMMEYMRTEAELATVLGHEIGHVTARHSVNQISKQEIAQLGLGIGSILSPSIARLGQVAGVGLQLLFLKYSRDDERQADELGFRYALAGGYDVRQMLNVFTTLQRVGEASGQSPLPSWLSTHPYPAERLQATQQRLAALQQPLQNTTVNEAQYLGQVNGMVFGDDPRSGYFRGAVFYHPGLRFRVEFPSSWAAQNLPQAVVAMSPQQDAAVQLTLSPEQSVSSAAQTFLSQEGVTAGAPVTQQINGLSAAVAPFQATTDQGNLRGLVAFVSYDGRVYQLLAYSVMAQYNQYDAVFRQVLSSFAPLTDPRALAVTPNRVEVVRVAQSMTLSQFAQQYPSTVDANTLAILNELPSATASVPAGTLLKRVVGGSAG
ncbi:MAG TPA: M48 family metalloprotease [Gemmatimonadaceae bacterium]|nr:M48 family metalloprotease [Gemmatimonadaceae bacterium]